MNFSQAISSGFSNYANFSGRAPRSALWWWVLFSILANFVAVAVDAAAIGMPALQMLVALGLLLPGLAVGVRRLHDLDKSGWWYLIGFVPVIGALILIFFFVQPGISGSNRFGADPLS